MMSKYHVSYWEYNQIPAEVVDRLLQADSTESEIQSRNLPS